MQTTQNRLGDFWESLGETILGVALIGAGIGGAILTKKYIKKKNKVYGYVGSGALGLFGAYKIYKGLKKEQAEAAQPGEVYAVNVINPRPGEKWSTLVWHTINAQIYNQYQSLKKVFVGMSMISEETGEVIDFRVKEISIDPNSEDKVSWTHWGRPDGKTGGVWYVVVAVWDKMPVPGGDATRLGEGESWCKYTFFG